jgi:hypothetical protein
LKSKFTEEMKSVVKMADKCANGNSCLESGCCGEIKRCTVERSSGENLLWLSGKTPLSCPYLLPFGYGHLCTCPVHSRLYKEEIQKTLSTAISMKQVDNK